MIRREDTCRAQAILRANGLPPFSYFLIGTNWCLINVSPLQSEMLFRSGVFIQ